MESTMVEHVDAVFARIKAGFDPRNSHGLTCRHELYGDSVVLKLQKPHWTNDRTEQLPDRSRIFFSLWMGPEDAARGRVNYNIHALKLRQFEGYSIPSREFAQAFRERFAAFQEAWPNVSVAYGPLTLMQGWVGVDVADAVGLEGQFLGLMEQFGPLSEMIDELLVARRR